jgi:hypothetical protein
MRRPSYADECLNLYVLYYRFLRSAIIFLSSKYAGQASNPEISYQGNQSEEIKTFLVQSVRIDKSDIKNRA